MHIPRTLFVALCALTLTLPVIATPAHAQPSGTTHSLKPAESKSHRAKPHAAKSTAARHHGAKSAKVVKAKGEKAKVPPVAVERTETGEPVIVHEGEASFYGGDFHGKKTASGTPFDQNKPTAASRELPLGTKATVTNQDNGKSVEVIVNDRGPYVDGRVIDLSKNAAKKLDMIDDGVAPVRVEAKPSAQPTEAAKEKVEAKAEKADKTQTAEKPANAQAGASGDQPGTGSGSSE
ncbi:septal ring lytic transglycosylase RlpA family protein [Azospirillum rugosum]|uniref:Endolytic peptidoglycan transglycosylase RlpA n=1 Tax=Azospirillum rugosum TaxID=416170 RepID=A0ABS4SNA0_9PROT|nr:septal ring lytic transglycosylase RlpA family protein [Azospirillum rugosum]MBP2294045.1 rare lipoprotein A [Azospirillum rugosum]MDQ0527566.1 rare lipoprotein A [Azospirillum rugosum]